MKYKSVSVLHKNTTFFRPVIILVDIKKKFYV